MANSELQRFLQSMQIGYAEWHDGLGYDLDALDRMSAEERQQVEDVLLARGAHDWRDVAALDHLGSERALSAVGDSMRSTNIDTSVEAVTRLAKRGLLTEAGVETFLLQALPRASVLNGLTKLLDFAQKHASDTVKRTLLWCALHGNDELRVSAGALAHYLYGGSSSPFDWSHRPLYLRLGSKNRDIRKSAYLELCRSVGADPDSSLPPPSSKTAP